MAGASVAFHLAPHARVTLLEREAHPGYHSSGRSAALYAPNYGSALIQRLTMAGESFLTEPPTGFSAAPLLQERGFLMMGKNAQLAVRDEYESASRVAGLENRRLSASELAAMVPVLRPEASDWALLDPNAWDIDVEALLQGYLRGARAHGARTLNLREVTSVEHAGSCWRIRGPEFDIQADVIVNAAGAWADELAAHAGFAPLGLVPHRRTAFIFDPPAGTAVSGWPLVTDAGAQFYFKPDAGRLLGSLSEEVPVPPGDAQPEDLDVAIAVDRIEQVVNFPIARVLRALGGIARVRSGPRPGIRVRARCGRFLLARGAGWLRHPDRARTRRLRGGDDTGESSAGRPHRARGRSDATRAAAVAVQRHVTPRSGLYCCSLIFCGC